MTLTANPDSTRGPISSTPGWSPSHQPERPPGQNASVPEDLFSECVAEGYDESAADMFDPAVVSF